VRHGWISAMFHRSLVDLNKSQKWQKMVRPTGLEPVAPRLGIIKHHFSMLSRHTLEINCRA